MKPYQERLVTERDELVEKLGRLETFMKRDLFLTLDLDEREGLKRQRAAMILYLQALNDRVAHIVDLNKLRSQDE